MITIEQRVELLKGGYSAEQIEQFAQQEQQPQQPQQQQQEQQPKQPEKLPEQPKQPEQLPAKQPEQLPEQLPEKQPEKQPEQDPGKDALQLIRDLFTSNQEVSKNMAKLTAAIQANALAGAGLPGGANNPTAEQALASIIAPEMKERR